MKLNSVQVLGIFKVFERMCHVESPDYIKRTDEVEIEVDETSFTVYVNGKCVIQVVTATCVVHP